MGYASGLDQRLAVTLSLTETEKRRKAEEIGDPDVFVTDDGALAKPSVDQAATPQTVEERQLGTWD
jgi:hypothetical protein